MATHGEEWHENRRKGIGGSDVAAIMGINPWKTPYQVYLEKRGETPAWDGNLATRWGQELEPVIRQWYTTETGRIVTIPEDIIQSDKYPILLANLDGVTDDGRVLEIKTARLARGWGEPGTDEIPDYYATQCHHYMLVTGMERCDVAASIGGAPPCLYHLEADKSVSDIIIQECHAFWDMVQNGTPPPPVSYADAVARYGKSAGKNQIVASEEMVTLIRKLSANREAAKIIEELDNEIKMKLISAMGDNADSIVNITGEALVTYKQSMGRRLLDIESLKKESPDIYLKYSKTGNPYRRFLIK